MTYNPNIPQANQLISQSQAQIQTNFAQLDTVFDIDHVTFDNATAGNRGKHRQSTYIQLAGDPTTAVDELAMYAKDLAGAETLYLRKESNGTVVQMSGRDPVVAASGETFLPGGLLMKWGQIGAASNGVAQNFPTAFPTACYSVVVCANVSGTLPSVGVNGFTTAGFTFRTSGGAIPITYVAIGA